MLAPEDVEYTYNGKLLSHKSEQNNAIRSNMDEHGDFILSEVTQIGKDKHRMISHMWNIEKWYRWTYLQDRSRVPDIENKLMVTKQDHGDVGRGKLGVWIQYAHTTVYKLGGQQRPTV